jgi:hypothetical protein
MRYDPNVLIFIGIFWAVVTGGIATRKNRNPFLWGGIGFLTGAIGAIIVGCLRRRVEDTPVSSTW